MYEHVVLFTLPRLLTIQVVKGNHTDLGGRTPHWKVEILLGRGAGHPFGRTAYFAHDLFARKTREQKLHHSTIHLQFGGSDQGVRVPYQMGISGEASDIPYVDDL
jgi:hypothetical protein